MPLARRHPDRAGVNRAKPGRRQWIGRKPWSLRRRGPGEPELAYCAREMRVPTSCSAVETLCTLSPKAVTVAPVDRIPPGREGPDHLDVGRHPMLGAAHPGVNVESSRPAPSGHPGHRAVGHHLAGLVPSADCPRPHATPARTCAVVRSSGRRRWAAADLRWRRLDRLDVLVQAITTVEVGDSAMVAPSAALMVQGLRANAAMLARRPARWRRWPRRLGSLRGGRQAGLASPQGVQSNAPHMPASFFSRRVRLARSWIGQSNRGPFKRLDLVRPQMSPRLFQRLVFGLEVGDHLAIVRRPRCSTATAGSPEVRGGSAPSLRSAVRGEGLHRVRHSLIPTPKA